jgi:DNA damage-binding protein 1
LLSGLAQFTCGENEEIASVLAFTSSVHNEEQPFFCIGTLVYKEAEIEPSSGRLIIITVAATSNGTAKEFKTVAIANVGGCVFALKSVGGKIVASVNSSVGFRMFSAHQANL